MRYFRKLTFGVALTFAAGALPNVGLGGEILPPGASPTTTAAYLSAHGGLQTHALFGGAALKTYAIGFPSSGTAGIETSYGPPGYVGSQDITFTASTKAVNDQTISWGTTNGNVNPLQIPALALVGGGFLLDGSGKAAQFALAPWLPQGLARMPAGLELRAGASPTGAQALDVRDRRVWSLWAQQRLQETQTYLDEMSKDPSRRDAFAKLSELANQYVVFIGFSERGDVRKMMGSLRRVSDISQQAKGTLCLKTRDFGPQACL